MDAGAVTQLHANDLYAWFVAGLQRCVAKPNCALVSLQTLVIAALRTKIHTLGPKQASCDKFNQVRAQLQLTFPALPQLILQLCWRQHTRVSKHRACTSLHTLQEADAKCREKRKAGSGTATRRPRRFRRSRPASRVGRADAGGLPGGRGYGCDDPDCDDPSMGGAIAVYQPKDGVGASRASRKVGRDHADAHAQQPPLNMPVSYFMLRDPNDDPMRGEKRADGPGLVHVAMSKYDGSGPATVG